MYHIFHRVHLPLNCLYSLVRIINYEKNSVSVRYHTYIILLYYYLHFFLKKKYFEYFY